MTTQLYDFISCDAVAFGSPNYFSYMAGLGYMAGLSLERMISSFRLQRVADGVVSRGEPNENDLVACKKLGEALVKEAIKRAEAPKESRINRCLLPASKPKTSFSTSTTLIWRLNWVWEKVQRRSL